MPKTFLQDTGSRKRHLFYGTAIGVLLTIGATEKVYAACSVAFTGGADTATCSGANGVISALSGSDFVTLIESASATDIFGNDGDDKLTIVNGSVADDVSGDSGADTIVLGFSIAEVLDDVTGGSGADQITIASSGIVGGDVLGDLGSDTITILGGAIVAGNVAGGSQADTLVVTGGLISGDVSGDGGNDRITITGGTIVDDVTGGSGNDTISIAGGAIGDAVDGGDLNDTILVTGGSMGDVFGGGDADTISIFAAGEVGDDVDGSTGNDTIVFAGSANDVLGNLGNDRITITGGFVNNDVGGGDQNDTITMAGGEVADDIQGNDGDDQILMTGGSAEQIVGGSGNDTISISAGQLVSASEAIIGGEGLDTILMSGGTLTGDVNAATGDDQITITGGQVGTDVRGELGNDTIFIAGASIEDQVRGQLGNDTIIIAAGAEIDGNVVLDEGEDRFTMTGGSVDDGVFGQDGNDIISILGGTITNQVLGGTGNDQISLAGGFVLTNIIGEEGNDTLVVAGGSVDVDVQGNTGTDTITIAGGEIAQDVEGNDGDDTISIAGGSIGDEVLGGTGDDSIVMTGGFVGDDIEGDDGDDRITVAGGTIVEDVLGDTGNDTISVTGGAIAQDVEGNDGADSLFISGGSMRDVFGGTGDDTIVVSGLADLQDDTIGGDNGSDTISLHGGDLANADVFGGSGDDTVDVNGAGGADYLFDVETIHGGTGTNDVALFSAFAGVLSEEFGGFEQVLLLNGTTLDVHNPNSVTPDDRDLSAGASGTPNILFVDASSTLEAGGNSPGDFTWTGDQANLGLVTMLDGSADDLYTVTGNYAGGAGGTSSLAIDAALDITELGDEFFFGSVADVTVPPPAGPLLVPEGTTALVVQDVGNGIGQLTGDDPGDGIAVIDVSGGSTDSDDFFLVGEPIQAGAVEYSLVLESDNIWYLQSQFLDQVFGYAAAPSAILGMARDYMGNLHERVGSLQQTWTGGATQISDGSGVWLRSGGFFGKVDGGSDFDELDYDQDHWFAQLGADLALLSDASTGQLIASVMGHAGYSTTTHDEDGNTEITKNHIYGYGGGLALTWYGGPEGWAGEGLYIDGIAQVTFYNVTTKTTAEGERGETDGWGWSIGMEAGYGINVGGERGGPRIVPQIQLVYSQVNLDDFTDEEGVIVEFDNADSLLGRLGVAVDSGKMWRSVNAYAEANIVQEFMGDTKVTVTTIPVEFDTGGTSVELGMGGTVSLLDNVNIYADVDYLIPFDNGRQGASVIGGVRISF